MEEKSLCVTLRQHFTTWLLPLSLAPEPVVLQRPTLSSLTSCLLFRGDCSHSSGFGCHLYPDYSQILISGPDLSWAPDLKFQLPPGHLYLDVPQVILSLYVLRQIWHFIPFHQNLPPYGLLVGQQGSVSSSESSQDLAILHISLFLMPPSSELPNSVVSCYFYSVFSMPATVSFI